MTKTLFTLLVAEYINSKWEVHWEHASYIINTKKQWRTFSRAERKKKPTCSDRKSRD